MPDEISFEEGLKKIEETIAILERGDLPLDESIAKFEEGMQIIDICTKRLEQAEQRIKKVAKVNGKISVESMEQKGI